MIIIASRRTDIPAWFSDWFLYRLREKYALVRNPVNSRQVSRIDLSPDIVDCIVFWSKNPRPMLDKLEQLQPYPFYFQFTLNAYGKDVEPNLPSLEERIDTFRALSCRLGKHRVIWRYDPILLTPDYSVFWHEEQFSYLAEKLSPYTEMCTFSFLDFYAKIHKRLKTLEIQDMNQKQQCIIAQKLARIAHFYSIQINTCGEELDLSPYQIDHASCIDPLLISRLTGYSLDVKKDKNQRPACGCVSSIDLGLYHTCRHECLYCYANCNSRIQERNASLYDPSSPLLCSHLTEEDKLTERQVKSLRVSYPSSPLQIPET